MICASQVASSRCLLRRRDGTRRERGAVLVVVGIAMLALVAVTSLGVDMGLVFVKRNELQLTADAAALSAVLRIGEESVARAGADTMVDQNMPFERDGNVLQTGDLDFGHWDPATRTFTGGGNPINAVRAITRRAAANGNALPLIFAAVFGRTEIDVAAVAVAARGGAGTRFLLDDEFIDSDIPVIVELAGRLGVPPDDLISDRDGDGFIDLPPGTELELPTGQVGDEGLFEIDPSEFQFGQDSTPYDLEDFLVHQDGEGPIPDGYLDPTLGVVAVDDPADYPDFVSDSVQVSPLYKSDISRLSPTTVNAKGERRGLLAFSVMAVGTDPAGSYLPNLVIRVESPSSVALGDVGLGAGSGTRLVM